MVKKTYSELLRDPRWQRKRLEILQRSEFSCELCGAVDRTLNVHHRVYRKGADPWEYPDDELVSLCGPCHEGEHSAREELKCLMAQMDTFDIERLVGYAKGILANRHWEAEDAGALPSIKIFHPEQTSGLADYLRIEPHDPEYDVLMQPEITIPDYIAIDVSGTQRLIARRKAVRGEN